MLVPWSIRNAMVMDSQIALSANMGYNLRIGHASYSNGRYLVPEDLWMEKPGISFKEREPLFNDLGAERARSYALHHPVRELALSGHKIVWLWRPDSDALVWVSTFGATPLAHGTRQPLRFALDASYLSVLALASIALFIGRSRRASIFVATWIAFWTAIHIVFFGEPRYHLPMLVMIVPGAAAGSIDAVFALRAAMSGDLVRPR